MKRPKFGLLIIGDEILSGRRSDKHLAKVIELLEARGMALSYARYLPDERDEIVEELKRQKPDIKVLVLGVFPRGSSGDAERSLEQIADGIKPINEE